MRQLVLKSGKYLFFFILIVLINSSCDEIESNIPDVRVDFTLNIEHTGINNIGTYYILGPGFGRGIIINCMDFTGNKLEYYAFDAACTHEASQTCQVLKDEEYDDKLCPCNLSSFILSCTCCESKFNIGDGAGFPIIGPATLPLKQYKTTLYGNTLRIYN